MLNLSGLLQSLEQKQAQNYKEYQDEDLRHCIEVLEKEKPEVLELVHKIWELSKAMRG